MHHVGIANGTPAECKDTRIQRHRAILPDRTEGYCLHAVAANCPTPAAALGLHMKGISLSKAKVCRQHSNLMAPFREPRRQRPHLKDGSAPFLKREIGLNHFQNAHVACYIRHETQNLKRWLGSFTLR